MNNKAVMLGLAVLAFLVAAVLVIMIFRMLFGGRLRMPGGRARQARLGIVDAFDLDRQRQLIIVRRDNTEHLIMIGGPNDLVIESEIIRAEAREVREARRDPSIGTNLGTSANDGRIPAPPPALEKGEPMLAGSARPAPKPAEEPMLPMAMPAAAPEPRREMAPEPARAPTFPLPPRRPPPPPPPERRPAPPPPLPASVSRGEDVPSLSGQPPALAPAPAAPIVPREPAAPPLVAAPLPPPAAGPAPAASPAAASPRRPPFLKPLSSRPPIRPLQRTTPQAPSSQPGGESVPPGPVLAVPASPARQVPPPAVPQAPPQAAANSDGDSKDALESLEEEMAKLLGRGG